MAGVLLGCVCVCLSLLARALCVSLSSVRHVLLLGRLCQATCRGWGQVWCGVGALCAPICMCAGARGGAASPLPVASSTPRAARQGSTDPGSWTRVLPRFTRKGVRGARPNLQRRTGWCAALFFGVSQRTRRRFFDTHTLPIAKGPAAIEERRALSWQGTHVNSAQRKESRDAASGLRHAARRLRAAALHLCGLQVCVGEKNMAAGSQRALQQARVRGQGRSRVSLSLLCSRPPPLNPPTTQTATCSSSRSRTTTACRGRCRPSCCSARC